LKQLSPGMSALLNNPKPTVVRQCLNAVQEIIVFRPELTAQILQVIGRIDLSKNVETMQAIIKQDINEIRDLAENSSQMNQTERVKQ